MIICAEATGTKKMAATSEIQIECLNNSLFLSRTIRRFAIAAIYGGEVVRSMLGREMTRKRFSQRAPNAPILIRQRAEEAAKSDNRYHRLQRRATPW